MPGTRSIVQEFSQAHRSIFEMMGHSTAVQQMQRQIERVACTNFTVILQGETGTGKELVARFIHDGSKRASRPFVAIDCGAIPDNLVESELFGYVKGAFTGADGKRAGYFEMARGGTLFLDEIGNLSLTTQMKLLRSLQERRILPLGSEKNLTTDIRIVVASNATLEDQVRVGNFRADLFHRLNEFKIYLTPLRQRREDIHFLAERFRHETNEELGKNVQGFTAEARTHLLSYDWPGNVRELRNAVRRAVLLSTDVIELKHLHQVMSQHEEPSLPMASGLGYDMPQGYGLHEIVREATGQLEKAIIQTVLQESEGNKSLAAKRLKIGYKTLYRKLKEYQID